MKFFERFRKKSPPADAVIIVSGLPRSGTSMMMQMLAAGGMEILTDEQRTADLDNPKGYYELEVVKKLKEGDNTWVNQAPGKAVKVISALLEGLPAGYHYKVIFMQREMAEVLASQKQMLIRRGEATDKVSDETMAELFGKHLLKVQSWLAAQDNFEVLYVPYAEMVGDALRLSERVVSFLGLPLDVQAMAKVPDPQLYRQKK
jgi:hypothetical protein